MTTMRFDFFCGGCGAPRTWNWSPCNCQERVTALFAQASEPAPTAAGRYAAASLAGFRVKDRPYPAVAVWEQSHYDKDANDGKGAWVDQSFTPAQQRMALQQALLAARGYVADPEGWLYLCGNYGSGKSHLASAIFNELAQSEPSSIAGAVADLLTDLRKRMQSRQTDKRLVELMEAKVLLLDDLGEGHLGDDWSSRTLADILSARYDHSLPTLITSNLPLEAIGGRIGSRLAEATPIVVVAYDYRRLPKAKAS